MDAPTRYVKLDPARLLYGERVERLGPKFFEGDPLADAASEALSGQERGEREKLLARLCQSPESMRDAPQAVRDFAVALHHVPAWVDYERATRGGAAMIRSGLYGGLVLAFRSLVLGYCSPAGNKPLAFSGRLKQDAPRRLAETGRFIHNVCLPGGVKPGAPGFSASVRVRLMHAQVRRFLARSPRWKRADWGVPINQVDMAGTVFLFSLVLMDGLSMMGFEMTPSEREDLFHLWRCTGHLMGVQDELLATNEAEARILWSLISSTQEAPDADSKGLADALVETARETTEPARARAIAFAYGLSRYLIGDERADALGYPKTMWRFVAPTLRSVLAPGHGLLRKLPRGEWLMQEVGMAYWHKVLKEGLGQDDATFEMPERVPHA